MPEEPVYHAKLKSLVNQTADMNNDIQHCILAVSSGDNSIAWSGAAGALKNQDEQDAQYYIASITKSYTATVIMMLYEKAILSLDDAISLYLPGDVVAGLCVIDSIDHSKDITIKHLLSHSSGIADYYSDPTADGYTAFDSFLEEPEKKWTVLDTVHFAKSRLKSHFTPGTGNHYSDTNYQLLGLIIEKATGKPLHAVYDELIFTPLELHNTWLTGYPRNESQKSALVNDIWLNGTAITKVRENGTYWADGGIISTATDGIAFLKALNQEKLISNETLALMQNWKSIHFPMEYGFGLDRINHPAMLQLWGHSGSSSSFLYYYEKDDLYISGTLNATDANRLSFDLIKQAVSIVKRFIRSRQALN